MRADFPPRHIPVFQIEIAGDHIAVGGTVRRAPNIGFGSRVGRTALGTLFRTVEVGRRFAVGNGRRLPLPPEQRIVAAPDEEIEILFEQQIRVVGLDQFQPIARRAVGISQIDADEDLCILRKIRPEIIAAVGRRGPSALRPSCSRNRANRRSYCCCNRVRPDIMFSTLPTPPLPL